jgi:glycosyltransferase involved in cell wall biosynthesis
MPSLCEGWGHPVFEALKFGMPVIATNYGGYLDFVHKGKNVQLIDGALDKAVGSPLFKAHERWFKPKFDELVGALKKAFALKMRKTGEDYVPEYTWDKTAEAIETALDTKVCSKRKVKVYYERMVQNLWNADNEIGFKTYAPVKYEFTNDPSNVDFQIIDITRLSDANYIKCKNYIVFFHCFGEWSEEPAMAFEKIFDDAMLVYSHLDLSAFYPHLPADKFMRGPWGVQPDLWYKEEGLTNDMFQILCTGEIAVTEGIREGVMACDAMKVKLLHVGTDFKYRNPSYVNKNKLAQNEMREAYNVSRFVSALRRVEGFEKPAIEGLLCGARPVCFDTALYRYWYGDLACYVREGTEEETLDDLVRVFQREYRPIEADEAERAIKKFAWYYVATNFWNRVAQTMEGTHVSNIA